MVFVKKYKVLLIILSVGLILFGLPLKQPAGFILFSIPGVLLGVFILLTTGGGNRFLSKKDNSADELLKWSKLKDEGVITDEEFQDKKNKILEG